MQGSAPQSSSSWDEIGGLTVELHQRLSELQELRGPLQAAASARCIPKQQDTPGEVKTASRIPAPSTTDACAHTLTILQEKCTMQQAELLQSEHRSAALQSLLGELGEEAQGECCELQLQLVQKQSELDAAISTIERMSKNPQKQDAQPRVNHHLLRDRLMCNEVLLTSLSSEAHSLSKEAQVLREDHHASHEQWSLGHHRLAVEIASLKRNFEISRRSWEIKESKLANAYPEMCQEEEMLKQALLGAKAEARSHLEQATLEEQSYKHASMEAQASEQALVLLLHNEKVELKEQTTSQMALQEQMESLMLHERSLQEALEVSNASRESESHEEPSFVSEKDARAQAYHAEEFLCSVLRQQEDDTKQKYEEAEAQLESIKQAYAQELTLAGAARSKAEWAEALAETTCSQHRVAFSDELCSMLAEQQQANQATSVVSAAFALELTAAKQSHEEVLKHMERREKESMEKLWSHEHEVCSATLVAGPDFAGGAAPMPTRGCDSGEHSAEDARTQAKAVEIQWGRFAQAALHNRAIARMLRQQAGLTRTCKGLRARAADLEHELHAALNSKVAQEIERHCEFGEKRLNAMEQQYFVQVQQVANAAELVLSEFRDAQEIWQMQLGVEEAWRQQAEDGWREAEVAAHRLRDAMEGASEELNATPDSLDTSTGHDLAEPNVRLELEEERKEAAQLRRKLAEAEETIGVLIVKNASP